MENPKLKAAVPADEMLAALRDAGGISEAEFEKAKTELIDA